jgi:hypothetical protein
MILYILAGISFGYIYYYYYYYSLFLNSSNNVTLESEFNNYIQSIDSVKDTSNIDIINNQKFNLFQWKNNIKYVNNELYRNNHIISFKPTIEHINNKNHLNYWIYDNMVNRLKKYSTIILNLKTIYDYDMNKLINKKYLDNISEFAHRNKIIFIIISELSPTNFDKITPKYFNKNNYFSPYHYKVKLFGTVQKLELSNIAIKPASITINRIILDIMNRYGCNNDNFIYIDNENLKGINTLIV